MPMFSDSNNWICAHHSSGYNLFNVIYLIQYDYIYVWCVYKIVVLIIFLMCKMCV